MFDELVSAAGQARGAEALTRCARLENAACAAKLAALVALLDAAHAADGSAEREFWLIDNWAAACAQGAAALGISRQLTSHLLQAAVMGINTEYTANAQDPARQPKPAPF